MAFKASFPQGFVCDFDFASLYQPSVAPLYEAFPPFPRRGGIRRLWEELVVVWRVMRPAGDFRIDANFRLEEAWVVSRVTNHNASSDPGADKVVLADEILASETNGSAIVERASSKEEALLRYAASGISADGGVWSVEGDQLIADVWSESYSPYSTGYARTGTRTYRLVKDSL